MCLSTKTCTWLAPSHEAAQRQSLTSLHCSNEANTMILVWHRRRCSKKHSKRTIVHSDVLSASCLLIRFGWIQLVDFRGIHALNVQVFHSFVEEIQRIDCSCWTDESTTDALFPVRSVGHASFEQRNRKNSRASELLSLQWIQYNDTMMAWFNHWSDAGPSTAFFCSRGGPIWSSLSIWIFASAGCQPWPASRSLGRPFLTLLRRRRSREFDRGSTVGIRFVQQINQFVAKRTALSTCT